MRLGNVAVTGDRDKSYLGGVVGVKVKWSVMKGEWEERNQSQRRVWFVNF